MAKVVAKARRPLIAHRPPSRSGSSARGAILGENPLKMLHQLRRLMASDIDRFFGAWIAPIAPGDKVAINCFRSATVVVESDMAYG